MSEPRVMAMLLTADRPEMTARAMRCFASQIYESRCLLIYDTGAKPLNIDQAVNLADNGVYYEYRPEDRGLTIGALRNLAMAFAHPLCLNADIIAHWDSDDWSHPNRIAEQVALLQTSGADCVGYNEMLFWETFPHYGPPEDTQREPRAWLYSLPRSNYALGTSLAYWRRVWEKKPFQDTNAGEDLRFIEGLNVKAITSMGEFVMRLGQETTVVSGNEPRMIASVHGSNTVLRIDDRSGQWRRVPEWDERLRTIMAL